MQVQVSVRGMELTQAIKEYGERKIAALGRFVKHEGHAHAELNLSKETGHHNHGELFLAEVSAHVGSTHYFARARSADLYASIDEVQEDLERQITQRHSKNISLLRRGGRALKEVLRKWRR